MCEIEPGDASSGLDAGECDISRGRESGVGVEIKLFRWKSSLVAESKENNPSTTLTRRTPRPSRTASPLLSPKQTKTN